MKSEIIEPVPARRHADSPHFVADQVEWLVRTYALRSQVLGALAAASQGAEASPAAGLRTGH